MARLKILISGAGIAGNALAFWLSNLGHEVTVIERFPGLRTNGLQLDLRGHGIEAMKRMGLEHAFRSNAAPEQGLQLVDTSGKRWAYFPANNKSGSKDVQSFSSDFEIMRNDLCQIMYDAAKDRVKYIFGMSIESFEEKDSSLEVRFTDGSTDHFDMLVGADGQGSHTRKMVLGSDVADAFRSFDEHVAYFTIPRPIQDGEEYVATLYIAAGGRVVMTRRNNARQLQVYMTGKSVSQRLKSVRKGDVKEEKQAFVDVYRGAGWQVDSILESLDTADDFYCEHQGLVKLDAWSHGRVTLLGDAAYCASAQSGQGTTCAMVGAYVLAGEIARHCGGKRDGEGHTKDAVMTALKAYEATFRPFMSQVQKGVGDRNFMDKIEWTPFAVAILYRILWLACLLRLDLVFGWLRGQKLKGWDLPEYEELLRDQGGTQACL